MNPALARLSSYPFERLRALLADATAPATLAPIAMWIGEPKHEPPAFVLEVLRANVHRLGSYPTVRGLPVLRAAMAEALQRSSLPPPATLDPETMVLPVNGTREGIFAVVQAMVDPSDAPVVVMPNPCYQIYEGATLLAGAEPYYLPTLASHDFVPDLDAVPESVWRRCQLLILCSPDNPTGAVLTLAQLRHALELAERYDFVIASDECYTDLYLDDSQPAPSLLAAAIAHGDAQYRRCLVFQSLSKRSSVPGLRSGLVAGDPHLIERFALYRTYHGCAMPELTQLASAAAWSDDTHVAENRRLYQRKYAAVLPLLADALDVARPAAAFYLWPDVHGDEERFTRALYERENVMVLPGSYMGRGAGGANPGRGRVRISLVPPLAQCVEAAQRIGEFLRARA